MANDQTVSLNDLHHLHVKLTITASLRLSKRGCGLVFVQSSPIPTVAVAVANACLTSFNSAM